ncbi:MAG: zinc ribbon domain-containing protein [Acidaminococcaceae bacterium]|jgi:endogenous inhibitor of DNA gyrase (YacG/DUF329 family)|nr:zinc ribbon domain-containing protein [Acidaminococcaceae bacterium]
MSIIWLVLCVGVGYYARAKGRNPWLWGLASVVLSPLIVGIVLALCKDKSQEVEMEELAREQQQIKDRVAMNEINNNKRFQEVEKAVQGGPEAAKVETTAAADLLTAVRTCPQCQQKVAAGSKFCNHCGYAFPVEATVATTETNTETTAEATTTTEATTPTADVTPMAATPDEAKAAATATTTTKTTETQQ